MYYEEITIEQLFQEELDALVAEHERMIARGDHDMAQVVHHVITYFKARLAEESEDWPSSVSDVPRTLH